MGYPVVCVMQCHEDHVRHTGLHMAITGCLDGHHLVLDEKIDDRQVMGGQVPQTIHVWLEQTQIHPQSIEIANPSELASANDCSDGLHCPRKKERVIHHQD